MSVGVGYCQYLYLNFKHIEYIKVYYEKRD